MDVTLMWMLKEIGSGLASPLGSIVYHLVLLLAVEAALGMAWGEWRRSRREQAQRLLFAMGGLIAVRIVHIVAGLLVGLGWAEGWVLLPPLERFADTASICLLGWAFMPPAKQRERTWDIVFGANLVVAVGICIGFVFLWSQTPYAADPPPDYNASWQATAWSLWQIGLIILASVAVWRNREEGWGIFLLSMAVMLAGRVLQLSYPGAMAYWPAWERLSNLIAYPLIAVAVYQNIVVRLRVHSLHLQDISQASLDQIKSLLYLFEASQQMSASLDQSTVLDNAVQGIARALDADQCAIAFPEEKDPGQMRLVAIYNPGRQGRGEGVTFPLEYQLTVQHALRRRKYVIGEEADNIQLKVLFALLGSSEIGPLLVQPLVDEGESIGAVIVGNARSRRPFTPNEAKLCQSMAEQVVGAIRNAKRYQDAQHRIASLSKEMTESTRSLNQSKGQLQKLTDRLTALQSELDDFRHREESAREARNALEIKLVSSRAEVNTLSERLAVLESDLSQAHANAEAQLRWHEEEMERRQEDWQAEASASERLRAAIQGMMAGVLIADDDGVIHEANVAAEILLDSDSLELQGLSLGEISDDERWQQAVSTAGGGEAVRLTTQVGPNTLMCDVAPLPDPDTGQMKGLIAILQDISTEAQTQQARLETIATMAEELRTPMTTIISYVDLLLSEAVGLISDAQRKFLSRIKTGAERVVHMTNDLIGEASGEEQWIAPKRQVVDVGKLIEGAVAKSCIQLEDKALSLDLALAQDLPAIKADPDYLRRVLANLLSNACLASLEGGEIQVWVGQSDGLPFDEEQMDLLNGDGFLIVSVRDAGGGLSSDALSRVFDRARPSQTPSGLGESGAGLALVKTLVEAHGGRLWVESEEGVGTTFSFVLPVDEQERRILAMQPFDDNGEGGVG